MHHVAILRKANISKGDNLLGDILAGTKTIESRWYVNKVAPWNQIAAGDTVYLKESGCPVTAKAQVTKVVQYADLTLQVMNEIIELYGKYIAPHTTKAEFIKWAQTQTSKRYCILIFLDQVERVQTFEINKAGYGISSAWLVTEDITKLIQ